MDILGKALLDFQKGMYTEDIKTISSLDEEDVMSIPYLFRDFKEMPPIEQKALELCQGKVLDVGCGTGSHSLYLQKNGFEVTALDQSPGAIEVCRKRGIRNSIQKEFLLYSETGFDTLLFLMNGIGISGKLQKLSSFFRHANRLLNPDGQILLDSSNIIYMFDQDEDGGHWIPGDVDYYGEVSFQMHYKNEKGAVFDWLYLDFDTLATYSKTVNLHCEMISEGEHYDYLAKLSLK